MRSVNAHPRGDAIRWQLVIPLARSASGRSCRLCNKAGTKQNSRNRSPAPGPVPGSGYLTHLGINGVVGKDEKRFSRNIAACKPSRVAGPP
eukprot:364829-Chlamydomonas_euryale.AAC.12